MSYVKFLEGLAFTLLALGVLALVLVIVNICRKRKPKVIVWGAVLVGAVASAGVLSIAYDSLHNYYSAFSFLRGDLCDDSPREALTRFQSAGAWFDARENAALLENFVGDVDNMILMDLSARYLSRPEKTISDKTLAGLLLKRIETSNDIDAGLRLLVDFGPALTRFFKEAPDTAKHCRAMREGLENVRLSDPEYQWLRQNASEKGKVTVYFTDTRKEETKMALGLTNHLPPARRLGAGDGASAVILVEHGAVRKGMYIVMGGTSKGAYQRQAVVKLCSVPEMKTLKDFGTVMGKEPPQNATFKPGSKENSHFGPPPDEAEVMRLVEKAAAALDDFVPMPER